MKIGVDLGGTNVRAALVDGTTVIRKEKTPCPAKGTQEEVIEAIAALIEPLVCEEVTSVGIGVPSVVDTTRGIVYNVANIPSWQEVHLKDIFEERFGIPVHINNDANCFALGESRFGQGRGSDFDTSWNTENLLLREFPSRTLFRIIDIDSVSCFFQFIKQCICSL